MVGVGSGLSCGGIEAAICRYRSITGAAPLYAQWVYGFWQCKEHYATQQGLLDAAHGFRNRCTHSVDLGANGRSCWFRSIPVDSIVQDWHYWGNLGWGPHWVPYDSITLTLILHLDLHSDHELILALMTGPCILC